MKEINKTAVQCEPGGLPGKLFNLLTEEEKSLLGKQQPYPHL